MATPKQHAKIIHEIDAKMIYTLGISFFSVRLIYATEYITPRVCRGTPMQATRITAGGRKTIITYNTTIQW